MYITHSHTYKFSWRNLANVKFHVAGGEVIFENSSEHSIPCVQRSMALLLSHALKVASTYISVINYREQPTELYLTVPVCQCRGDKPLT